MTCTSEELEFGQPSWMLSKGAADLVPKENMRLPWQHRLFEGRNPGRVVGAFEVLVVLIGKGPDSNKHTNVGQQSRKISIWFLALTRGQVPFKFAS